MTLVGGHPPRAAGNPLLRPLQRVMSTAGETGGRTPQPQATGPAPIPDAGSRPPCILFDPRASRRHFLLHDFREGEW